MGKEAWQVGTDRLETWRAVRQAIRLLDSVETGLVESRPKLLVEPALETVARAKAAAEDLLADLRALVVQRAPPPVEQALRERRAQHREREERDRLDKLAADRAAGLVTVSPVKLEARRLRERDRGRARKAARRAAAP